MPGLEERKKVIYAKYDFAKEGGAVGDIALRGGVLPLNAIVTNTTVDVETAVTSGGAATVAAKAEGAGDLLAATAKASLSLAAIVAGAADGTAGKMVRCTANRTPTITVAVAALTAGKFTLMIEYLDPR